MYTYIHLALNKEDLLNKDRIFPVTFAFNENRFAIASELFYIILKIKSLPITVNSHKKPNCFFNSFVWSNRDYVYILKWFTNK